MSYPLSSVHKLIYEIIYPEAISRNDAACCLPDMWKQIEQEIEASRLHLFEQLSQASGTDSLKVIIYTCQAGYTALIKRLQLYIHQTETEATTIAKSSFIQKQYSDIRKLLIAHLNELYTQYFPFFDSEQYVPKFILHHKTYQLKAQIENIRKQLRPLCNDPFLPASICSSLEQVFMPQHPSITYKQFHYYRQFVAELNRWCFTIKPFADPASLIDFLIKRNFNEPAFIEYIIEQLRRQIPADMTLQEQAEKWAFHVKEFSQIALTTLHSLHPQRQSVKACLVHAAEQELFFVKQKILLLPATTNASLPIPTGKKPIVTQMTVSQLGVFTRLLMDCKMIQHDNQTELLKLIAGCLTTTKAAQISAESLRVRYYNPDRASITITKEYLLQMLKRLNQY